MEEVRKSRLGHKMDVYKVKMIVETTTCQECGQPIEIGDWMYMSINTEEFFCSSNCLDRQFSLEELKEKTP